MSKHLKFIRVDDLAAEVEVDLIESTTDWGPYLSAEDARKLDEVRVALRTGDLKAAMRLVRVFRLTPITAA
jgi:hypothetical protein